MGKENGRVIFYSMAGAYLVYLAISMVGGLGEITGVQKIVIIIAMVVFVVVGAGLVCWGISKGIRQVKDASMGGPEKEEQPLAEPEQQEAGRLQPESDEEQSRSEQEDS